MTGSTITENVFLVVFAGLTCILAILVCRTIILLRKLRRFGERVPAFVNGHRDPTPGEVESGVWKFSHVTYRWRGKDEGVWVPRHLAMNEMIEVVVLPSTGMPYSISHEVKSLVYFVIGLVFCIGFVIRY